MKITSVFALLLVALQDNKPEPTTIDLEVLKSKHVAVQVKVNGEGPFRLIFDTGSPVTLISNRVAKKANVQATGGLMGMGGQATADSFEVGTLKAEKQPVIVMDHPTVKLLAKACGELDGIVGLSFFGRYRTVIDYQASKLILTPCDYKPQDVMAKMQEKLMSGRSKEKKVLPREVVLGLTLADEEPLVKSVAPGSAADEAGLKAGDSITRYDGRWVEKASDVFEIAPLIPAGEAVPIKVRREGKEVELTIKSRKGL
jgi:membrane-associated protease RseP (regulator of RpoE activity)